MIAGFNGGEGNTIDALVPLPAFPGVPAVMLRGAPTQEPRAPLPLSSRLPARGVRTGVIVVVSMVAVLFVAGVLSLVACCHLGRHVQRQAEPTRFEGAQPGDGILIFVGQPREAISEFLYGAPPPGASDIFAWAEEASCRLQALGVPAHEADGLRPDRARTVEERACEQQRVQEEALRLYNRELIIPSRESGEGRATLYSEMNRLLRTAVSVELNRHGLSELIDQHTGGCFAPFAKLLVAALRLAPAPDETRGVPFMYYRVQRISVGLLRRLGQSAGKLCLFTAFISFSLSEKVALMFRGPREGVQVMFILGKTNQARDVNCWSCVPGEEQVLLPPGSVVKIARVGRRPDGLECVWFEDWQ